VAKPYNGPKRQSASKLPPFVAWLRVAGVAGQVFGWAGLAWGGPLFWFGSPLFYISLACLCLDLCYEPNLRPRTKIIATLVFILFAGVLSWKLIFVGAPLDVSAFVTDGDWPLGTTIADIPFRPEFTELRVSIRNSSDRSYDDLNIVVRPDVAVAGIGQTSNIPGVSFEDKNGLNTRMLEVNTQTNQSKVVPLILLATDAGYRIRCPHLQSGAAIEIVLAIADVRWNPSPPGSGGQIRDVNYVLRWKSDDFSTYWL
jgi:hypothetical protein